MVKRKKSEAKKKDVESKIEKKAEDKEKIITPSVEDLFSNDIHLSKEQLLTIKVSMLERDNLKKSTESLHHKIQFLDREKELLNLKMSNLKSELTENDKKHKNMIDQIGKEVGVKLRDCGIDWETGKITFV